MAGEWPQHDVSILIDGGRLVIGDGYRAKNEELASAGLPFARAGNINNGFQFDDADHFPEASLARAGNKVSQPGDVVFTSKGTVGRFAFVRPGTPRFVYSPQLCFWRSLDKSLIDPRFLYFWMYGREFFVQFKGVAGQTDMAEYVSLSDQRRMQITLPPLTEQRAIAHILGTLDDKIELNRRMSETLEAMARALFKSWFVDFDPVRAKAEGCDAGLPDAIAKFFPDSFDDSELGEIPAGWSRRVLGDWAEALSGGTPSKSNETLWGGTIPWISPKVMCAIHADEAENFVAEEAIGNGTRLAPTGATLVMVRGMGLHQEVRISQARLDVAFNQDVKALVPSKIDANLLLFALLNGQQELLGRVESSGHGTGRLPTDVLLAHQITMPDEMTQAFLAAPFFNMSNRVAIAREEARMLAALRDALLPKLISGELRLGDPERILERAG